MEILDWLRYRWDRVAAVMAVAAGIVALVLGWFGVSRSRLTVQQIPYIVSGAVFGLLAVGVGATLWLSADLRDEWRRLDDIYRAITPAEPVPVAGSSRQRLSFEDGLADRRDPLRAVETGS